MTPTDKIKFKDQAQTRALTFFASTDTKKRLDSEYYVEGYAARYERMNCIGISTANPCTNVLNAAVSTNAI